MNRISGAVLWTLVALDTSWIFRLISAKICCTCENLDVRPIQKYVFYYVCLFLSQSHSV